MIEFNHLSAENNNIFVRVTIALKNFWCCEFKSFFRNELGESDSEQESGVAAAAAAG